MVCFSTYIGQYNGAFYWRNRFILTVVSFWAPYAVRALRLVHERETCRTRRRVLFPWHRPDQLPQLTKASQTWPAPALMLKLRFTRAKFDPMGWRSSVTIEQIYLRKKKKLVRKSFPSLLNSINFKGKLIYDDSIKGKRAKRLQKGPYV